MSKPFEVKIPALKSRARESAPGDGDKVDQAAESLGFVERDPQRRRGRPKSPRTAQVHAHVLPEVREEILAEARHRGVQQGVLIEEAWALYKRENGLDS